MIELTCIAEADEQGIHLPIIVDLVLLQRRRQYLPAWILQSDPEPLVCVGGAGLGSAGKELGEGCNWDLFVFVDNDRPLEVLVVGEVVVGIIPLPESIRASGGGWTPSFVPFC
jgi:hypothetical protein